MQKDGSRGKSGENAGSHGRKRYKTELRCGQYLRLVPDSAPGRGRRPLPTAEGSPFWIETVGEGLCWSGGWGPANVPMHDLYHQFSRRAEAEGIRSWEAQSGPRPCFARGNQAAAEISFWIPRRGALTLKKGDDTIDPWKKRGKGGERGNERESRRSGMRAEGI